MPSKFQPIQKRTGEKTGRLLTAEEKTAHESNPHLRGKYRYEEVKQPDPPKEAKKAPKKANPADKAE